MCTLHEKSAQQAFLYVVVEFTIIRGCRAHLKALLYSHILELVPDVLGLVEGSKIQEILPTPVSVEVL
jgi:hypothetical protein